MISLHPVRSALFLPASNPRAVAKARTLPPDLVILDLEDSVPDADKDAARDAAVAAARDWPGLLAIRVNAPGTPFHAADVAAVAASAAPILALPKAEDPAQVRALPKPVLAMIETPAGVYAAREIAAIETVVGLMAGSNDLAAILRLPGGRDGLAYALQAIVLAARAAAIAVLDGVFNAIDDGEAFAADCRAGRSLGFDGKGVIHPSQIDPANRLFGPTAAEIEDAQALVAAATGGAERFRGRMIEAMHVASARQVLVRAGVA
jgi:citrate lyase subunit beta/citryl-CoA lyase